MKFLTRHGDEIVDEFFECGWDYFRDLITPVDVTPCQKFLSEVDYDLGSLRDDLGCVRLPWNRCWVEYYEGTGNVQRVGCHVSRAHEKNLQVLRERVGPEATSKLLENDEAEHVVETIMFNSLPNEQWEYAGVIYCFLDEEGRLVSDRERRIYPMYSRRYKQFAQDPNPQRLQTTLVIQLLPVLLGFAFSHCPNVTVEEKSKPEAVRQKRIKSGKNPGQTFKVLDIEPLKKKIRRESAETGEPESKRARHLVRGHFKHYTEDAPLFGHTTGNVWCPPHKRGDEEEGRVEKDYRVNSP